MPNIKNDESLTREYILEWLNYDPVTGSFTWRKSPALQIKVGSEAGTVKSGTAKPYRNIRLHGHMLSASRTAWFITYGVWPVGRLTFRDHNQLNLAASNLRDALSEGTPEERSDLKRRAIRGYALKRYYNLSIEEYDAILEEQNGVCAICKRVERVIVQGKPRPLAVDHNHTTGEIRGLLCSPCNTYLGMMKENPKSIRKMIEYVKEFRDGQ